MHSEFQNSKQRLEELVGKSLSVSTRTRSTSTKGDVKKVWEFQGGEQIDARWIDTTQTTAEIIDEDSAIYAEVIIHKIDRTSVALIDWVEVIDQDYWGEGVGRLLHEEAVKYIRESLDVNKIYTKLDNTKMLKPILDSGFKQLDVDTTTPWYVLEL